MRKSTESGTTKSPTSEWKSRISTKSKSRSTKSNSKSVTGTKWKNSDNDKLKWFNGLPTKWRKSKTTTIRQGNACWKIWSRSRPGRKSWRGWRRNCNIKKCKQTDHMNEEYQKVIFCRGNFSATWCPALQNGYIFILVWIRRILLQRCLKLRIYFQFPFLSHLGPFEFPALLFIRLWWIRV